MAFIVETGEGIPGANSYNSIDEITAYHASIGNSGWDGLTVEQQEAAAIRAAMYLDGTYGTKATGKKKHANQGLVFPRINAIYMNGDPIDPDSVPGAYKSAHAELALMVVNQVQLTTNIEAGYVLKSKTIDVISKTWDTDKINYQPIFGWLNVLLASLFAPQLATDTLEIGALVRA